MGTTVIVGNRNGKKIVMNTNDANTASRFYSSNSKRTNSICDQVSKRTSEISDKIKESFSNAPISLKFTITPKKDSICVDYMFSKRGLAEVLYKDTVKNGSFDFDIMVQALLACIYKDCMLQMSDKGFQKNIKNREKEFIISEARKHVNEEFKTNLNNGLGFKGEELIAEFDGETFQIEMPEDWPDMKRYIIIEGEGKNVKLTYPIKNREDRVSDAVSELNKKFFGIKYYSKRMAPSVKEVEEKKAEIIEKHSILLDGLKNKKIFPAPKLYYMVDSPSSKYLETAAGVFSTCSDWAFVEFREEFSEEAAMIMSETYHSLLDRFMEEMKNAGYKHVEYNGGAGLMNSGITTLLMGTGEKGSKNIHVDIELADGMNLKNIDKVIRQIKKSYKDALAVIKEERKKIFEERMADTAIHFKGKRAFGYRFPKLYTGEATQAMFLYIDKNGGRITRKVFDKFVKEKCFADDLLDMMMYLMARADVIRFNDKEVILAPKAKYMRVFVYEALGIDESGVNKAIKELSKTLEKLKTERNEAKTKND